MTVFDYVGTLETNKLTEQKIMEATEKDVSGNSAEAEPSAPLAKVNRCTGLPSDVVSRNACGYFDIINEIRQNPLNFIGTLKDRQKKIVENGDL